MPNIKFVRADGEAMPLEKLAEFADFMGGCINTKTAEMADVVFDARTNLRDSEYKELSEMCGKIREMAEALHEVTSMFAKGLSGMGEIYNNQEKNLYKVRTAMGVLSKKIEERDEKLYTYRTGVKLMSKCRDEEILKKSQTLVNLEERPIICSCGNKYVSMVGRKRHRKKKKCPTLRQDS